MLPAKFRGPCLALTTVIFWGTLPIALKQVVASVDVFTIVWLRFTTIALWMWLVLPHRAEGRLFLPLVRLFSHNPALSHLVASGPYNRKRTLLLILVAAAGLGGNFVLYNCSVIYLTASACQIVSQAGPMLLMLGSVLFLHESMHRIQVVGIPVLLLGITLFFNQSLGDLINPAAGTGTGVLVGLAATLVWAMFGIAQKVVLREMASGRLMRLIYTLIALGLFPLATPSHLLNINSLFQALCLAYCCVNTLFAYGAFTKAMTVWETPKIGAVLTLTPLATLLFAHLFHLMAPARFFSENLNLLGFVGAFVTMSGACLIAVGPQLKTLLPWHAKN